MTQAIHGIICYFIVGITVVIVTYLRRPETVDIVKKQADMFPPPYNKVTFSLLSGLLVILFPLVLVTQIIHIIRHWGKQ